jgi:SHS2 domain-containing protein
MHFPFPDSQISSDHKYIVCDGPFSDSIKSGRRDGTIVAKRISGPIIENFEHKADIGVRGKGKTLEEAFIGGALSMMGIMFDIKAIKPQTVIAIKCDADDIEALFVEWLNAILSKRDLETMVFCRFETKIEDQDGSGTEESQKLLTGKAWGERYDQSKHEAKLEVKAATYSQLKVFKEETSGLYVAQCIVDV